MTLLKAADVLDRVDVRLDLNGKFHLVTDDHAAILVKIDGEFWMLRAQRSDERGRTQL